MVAQKQTPPAGGVAKDFSLPKKKGQSLTNGLKTVMVQYGEIPKVTVQLIIKTGNVHEGPNEVWLSDLTGRMIKEGTASMNFKTISQKVAAMGGSINISVGPDQTFISGSALSEFAPEFIKLLADVIMHPAFPEKELERLKGDLKRDLNIARTRPQSQASEQFYQAMFKDHPYGRYFPTEEMLNSYSIKSVKDHYNKNFGAKRSVLYIAGKFNEAPVAAAVQAAFSKWKAGPEISYPPVTVNTGTDTLLTDRKSAPQTTILVGLPTVKPTEQDYVPQMVTNALLGGSFFSRITANIRENKGYTYSPNSAVQNRKGVTLWVEQADVTSEHSADALKEIKNEITRLQNEPPSKEELMGIQNYQAGIFVLQNSSPGGIIAQLNFLDQYGLDDSFLTNLVKNVYKVTPEKVSEIAKKYIQFDKMKVVMVGDKASVQKQMGIADVKRGF